MIINRPLVSVIVRTYNNRNLLLKEAIESIALQSYKNIEIVIVEDGSEYVSNILYWIKEKTDFNVIYIPISKSGRCVAGNTGLTNCNGDYVVFLDDDDKFFESHIEDLMNALQESGVLVAYSNAYEVETEFITTEPLKYIERGKNVIYNQDFSRVLLWRQNYMAIQSVLFDRKLFFECGGFDIELDALEDWHLWMKFSLKTDFYHLNKVTSMYRVPYRNSLSNDRLIAMEQYKQKVFEKQKELRVNLSINEFNAMLDEVNKKTRLISISKDNVRDFILKHKWLSCMYGISRKIYYVLLK